MIRNGVTIDDESMLRLLTSYDNGWIDDAIVNAYIKLVLAHAKNPTWDAFDASVYTLMEHGEWTAVLEYAFQPDLTKLIVPICRNLHWSVGVIDVDQRLFDLYDSTHAYDTTTIQTLLEYTLRKFGVPFSFRIHHQMPAQTNGNDCGVYMLSYIKHLVLGRSLMYSLPSTERLIIAHELHHSQLVMT